MERTVVLPSLLFSILCLRSVHSLFESCNHVLDMKQGQKIYINSPYYPSEYPIGTSCRYRVQAPLDHEITFSCSVTLNVASTTPRCQGEVFTFNSEGNEILTESDYICESTQFQRKSFMNNAAISYISPPFYRRDMFKNAEHDLESEVDDDWESDRNISTTVPPSLNDTISNPFMKLTKLLTKNLTVIDYPEATSERAKINTTQNGGKAKTTNLKKSFLHPRRRVFATSKSLKFAERSARIVTNISNSNSNGNPYYGYIGNRGGGRFSCLVEVVRPPCDCGWSVSLKIAGATGVAGINEFPSMAGIKMVRNNKIFCGAAIISHYYLISAAHCFITPETNRSDLIRVIVGENDLTTVHETLYTRTYDVAAIIPHEQFYMNTRTLRNDIALLRTRLPIEWNRSVGPACLPILAREVPGYDTPRRPPLPKQRLDTVGWGTTSFGGQQSTQLLKTTLDVIGTEKCRRILRYVPPGVFCTLTPGRDTCQYDSGGALYARAERLFAVGIVSYGFACATQRPSINTRIGTFIKWIRAKTPEVNYCIK